VRHASESLGDPRRGYPRDERGVGRRVCPDRRETRRRVAVDDEKNESAVRVRVELRSWSLLFATIHRTRTENASALK